MAKKITVFIVSLCIFLLSAIPVYADYTVPFDKIAEGKGITWNDDYYTVLISDDYYYVIPNNFNAKNEYNSSGYYFEIIDTGVNVKYVGGMAYSPAFYQVPRSNPYGEWTKLNNSLGYYGGGSGETLSKTHIAYSSVDLYNNAGDLVFQRTLLGQTTQGGTIQGNSILSSNLSKSWLQNVLNELIVCIPILFPVLITFIAIRKGIAFCLTILKTA